MPFPAIVSAVAVKCIAVTGAGATGAIDSGVLKVAISTVGGLGGAWIKKMIAEQAQDSLLNQEIVKWVGGIALVGVIIWGGSKLVDKQADKGFEIDTSLNLKKMVVNFKNKKVTKEAFEQVSNEFNFTSGLQKAVQDFQKEHNWTSQQVYNRLLQEFQAMTNFSNVSDDAKKAFASKISGYIFD